jgi:hypothetical protein
MSRYARNIDRAQPVLCWIFARVWRKWIFPDWVGRPSRVVRVIGWKSALIDSHSGCRHRMTVCLFSLEKPKS